MAGLVQISTIEGQANNINRLTHFVNRVISRWDRRVSFSGFLLTQLGRDYPIWLAAIISSLIFALLHLVWEKKETVPQLPGLWLMGMVLVLARLVNDGNLGIAWGLHSGWVWAIGCIDTAGLINYTGNVPEWVTGKNKNP